LAAAESWAVCVTQIIKNVLDTNLALTDMEQRQLGDRHK
jgi:hypothetical protein